MRFAWAFVFVIGCSSSSDPAAPASEETGVDATSETASEVGSDARTDTATDAGTDARGRSGDRLASYAGTEGFDPLGRNRVECSVGVHCLVNNLSPLLVDPPSGLCARVQGPSFSSRSPWNFRPTTSPTSSSTPTVSSKSRAPTSKTSMVLSSSPPRTHRVPAQAATARGGLRRARGQGPSPEASAHEHR